MMRMTTITSLLPLFASTPSGSSGARWLWLSLSPGFHKLVSAALQEGAPSVLQGVEPERVTHPQG